MVPALIDLPFSTYKNVYLCSAPTFIILPLVLHIFGGFNNFYKN